MAANGVVDLEPPDRLACVETAGDKHLLRIYLLYVIVDEIGSKNFKLCVVNVDRTRQSHRAICIARWGRRSFYR